MKVRITIAILLSFILTLIIGTASVMAADGTATFFISVFHNVKGDEIGLTREAPVRISVVKADQIFAFLPMEYRQRVDANLPGGDYVFIFNDANTGDTLFTCGPYRFDNGDDIRMQVHEQGPGRNPDCFVRSK